MKCKVCEFVHNTLPFGTTIKLNAQGNPDCRICQNLLCELCVNRLGVELPMRYCLSCIHLYENKAEHDWSDVTPGASFKLVCGKGFWSFNEYEGPTIKELLEQAQICTQYTEAESRQIETAS